MSGLRRSLAGTSDRPAQALRQGRRPAAARRWARPGPSACVRAARSPMTRVAKVLWAAGQGARRKALRVRRQREKEARARSGFSGYAVTLNQGVLGVC